jgi:hypothetical protein
VLTVHRKIAATVSGCVLCPYGLWPTSNLLRIWEVPIFNLDLKAGCLDRRFVVLFMTFKQMLAGASKRAVSVVKFFHIHYVIIMSFDAVKLGINKESLKIQRLGHHDQLTILVSSMVYRNLFTYSFALWPSGSLGVLNYGCPFFPIVCLLSPSLDPHLPQILLQNFQPSRSRSSLSCASLRFTLRYSISCPSLTNCYYMSNPFQYLFLNICYYSSFINQQTRNI